MIMTPFIIDIPLCSCGTRGPHSLLVHDKIIVAQTEGHHERKVEE